MKKRILIFLIIVVSCLGFLVTKEAKAGSEDNVYGWAWSENIGWISFNDCTDPLIPATCGPITYGVKIDSSTGNFSGYAWSRGTDTDIGGVGWIRFNPPTSDGYPVVGPNYSACLDLPEAGQVCDGEGDYTVSGWARACSVFPEGSCSGALRPDSERGGWDGWIKLRGNIQGGGTYGVDLDLNVGPPYQFHNWAWGGDDSEAVVGLISFNCAEGGNSQTNICVNSDYKVMTNLSLTPVNNFPTITSASKGTPDYCSASPTGLIPFSWVYGDDEGDDQSEFNLQIATDEAFSNKIVDRFISQTIVISPGGTGDGTSGVSVKQVPAGGELQIGYGGSYYWRIKAKAENGDWSDWAPSPSGESFSTDSHPYPNPNFTPSANPRLDELVSFTDNSTCYTATGSYLCKDNTYGLLSSYKWDFDYPPLGPDNTTIGNTNYTYTEANGYSSGQNIKVMLEVTDDVGMCPDDVDFTLGAAASILPLPHWKEIAPF